ncbi:MAG: hypothetical protein AB8B78_12130 [Polaribacter sp.]
MKSKTIIAIVSLVLLFNSCKENEKDNIICTLEFIYGINITLIDVKTSKPISDNVKAVIKDGNYEEILEVIESNVPLLGAGERAGTYIVTITSDNYKTFVSEPIIVKANECHVIPEVKTFKLEPKI